MANLNLIVTPPTSTRASKTSADAAILDAMVAQISADAWVTDGKQYKKYKDAARAVGPYRRALPGRLNLPVHQMRSKVWGTDAKGVIITDRDKQGTWVFALSTAPDRQPRAPKGSANGTPAAGSAGGNS